MASRITNGGSYGINAKQARVIRLIAEGHAIEDIITVEYGIDCKNPENKKQVAKIKGTITRWTHDPKVMECYRAILREAAMFGVGKANNVLIKTMDSPNEWAAMQAAQGYLARYGDTMMGEDNRETVIRIEGMPTLGAPKTEGEE